MLHVARKIVIVNERFCSHQTGSDVLLLARFDRIVTLLLYSPEKYLECRF